MQQLITLCQQFRDWLYAWLDSCKPLTPEVRDRIRAEIDAHEAGRMTLPRPTDEQRERCRQIVRDAIERGQHEDAATLPVGPDDFSTGAEPERLGDYPPSAESLMGSQAQSVKPDRLPSVWRHNVSAGQRSLTNLRAAADEQLHATCQGANNQ